MKFKYNLCFLLLIISVLSVSCENIDSNSSQFNVTYPDCILQGWLKYVQVDTTNIVLPSDFLRNDYFYKQVKDNSQIKLTEKLNDIFINIPYINYFYFELFIDRINIYTARFDKYRFLKDTIYLNDINNEINCKRPGVEDLGKFNEGNCFAIRYRRTLMMEACADTLSEKMAWIDGIIKKKGSLTVNKGLLKPENTFNLFKFNQISNYQPRSLFEFNNQLLKNMKRDVSHVEKLDLNTNDKEIIHNIILSNDILNKNVNQISNAPVKINNNIAGYLNDEFLGDNFLVKFPPNPIATILNTDMQLKKAIRDADHQIISETSVQRIFDEKDIWEFTGEWTNCSRPCGSGTQRRYRRCVTNKCEGKNYIEKRCNPTPCGDQFLSQDYKIKTILNNHQVPENHDAIKITHQNYHGFRIFDISNTLIKSWDFPSEDLFLTPISTWGTCSKTCNGGLHRRELQCIDTNSRIRCPSAQKYFQEEDCNSDPCAITEKMRIEIRQVFPRPQKFIKCKIKEGDVYFVREDVQTAQTNPLVPVRVVLTNYFFTVYLSLNEKLFELKLEDIKAVLRSITNPTCFKVLVINKNVYKFCQLGTEPHATSKEWINDIIQFKTECNVYSKSAINNPFKINFNQYNRLYDYYDWPDRESLMQYILDNSREEDFSKDQDLLCEKMKIFINKSDKLLAKLKQYEQRKENERAYEFLQIKEEIRQLLIKEKTIGENIAKAIHKLEEEKHYKLRNVELKNKFDKTIGQIKENIFKTKLDYANRSIIAEKSKINIGEEDSIKTIHFYSQHTKTAQLKKKKIIENN